MKIANLILSLLFIMAAALQFNDSDPYLWISIYSIGALNSFLAFRGSYYPRISLLFATLFLVYSIYLFFSKNGVLAWVLEHQSENIAKSMRASAPWIEETREFFGLLILIVVLMANYFNPRGNSGVIK